MYVFNSRPQDEVAKNIKKTKKLTQDWLSLLPLLIFPNRTKALEGGRGLVTPRLAGRQPGDGRFQVAT